MSYTRFKEIVKDVWQRVARKISPEISSSRNCSNQLTRDMGQARWKPHLFAYRLLGERTNRLLPLFKDMDSGLRKSGIRISFKPYVSITVLASLIVSSATFVLTPSLLYLVLQMPLSSSLLFGIGTSLFAGAFTVIFFYSYPLYRADSIRRDLEDSMAFTASYMAILAGAGVPPDNIFRSLSKIPQKLAIVDESRTVVRDVELFGADIITALDNASRRTASQKFKELLEGFITTIHSGGNLMSYLLQRSRQNMRSKRIALRKFSDTLGILSEFYVTLLVAGPLILVVMLAVMSMLGGPGLGILDPTLLLMLLTYIAIPTGSIIFLIILDALTPRW